MINIRLRFRSILGFIGHFKSELTNRNHALLGVIYNPFKGVVPKGKNEWITLNIFGTGFGNGSGMTSVLQV